MSPFFELGPVPAQCNLLWRTRDEARRAPRGTIRLGLCQACGFIFNTAFNPALTSYTGEYENSLHFSPRFRDYAISLAASLVDRYMLYGKEVVEIGCGQGDFLRMLCDAGAARGVGFDPGYRQEDTLRAGPVTIVPEPFSSYGTLDAAFICCRHTLEHIERPREFLSGLARALHPGTPVYFEVPNAMHTLRGGGVWDLIYEHCSYFTGSSLASIFAASGFKVRDVYTAYGGQFLGLEAELSTSPLPGAGPPPDLRDTISGFALGFRERLDEWQERVARWLQDGHRVVVWGGGSKGAMFLNIVNACRGIEYAVDMNPRKQGCYVPGTGQELVAPEFLVDYRPDEVIVMNPIYEDEVVGLISYHGLSPAVVIA